MPPSMDTEFPAATRLPGLDLTFADLAGRDGLIRLDKVWKTKR